MTECFRYSTHLLILHGVHWTDVVATWVWLTLLSIRVNIRESKSLKALSDRLTREMPKLEIPVSSLLGKLWKPPTADIMDARRRH